MDVCIANTILSSNRRSHSRLILINAFVIADGATPGSSAIRKSPGACRPSGLACESEECLCYMLQEFVLSGAREAAEEVDAMKGPADTSRGSSQSEESRVGEDCRSRWSPS